MNYRHILNWTVCVATLAGAFHVAHAQTGAPIPVVRGALSPDLAAALQAQRLPVQVATCPAGFQERFANQKLACERHQPQSDNIKCPASFPNFTARNVTHGSDRDLCTKAGVVITSDGSLTNFTEGRDYVFVPRNGVRNGVSFLASHPNATAADGWTLDSTNTGASGITDRYKRTIVLRKAPILVNP